MSIFDEIKKIVNEQQVYTKSLNEILSGSVKTIDDNILTVNLNDSNNISLSIQNKTTKHKVYFGEEGISLLLNYLNSNIMNLNNVSTPSDNKSSKSSKQNK